MKIERKKNAIKGTVTGMAVKAIQLLFPFAIRTVIIKNLGIEYLGLNSLFASILQVLNLAELGVSSALVFSMYRPIAEDDTKKICELMNLYRYYYRIIGFIVLVAGLIITPFLPLLIEGDIPQDVNLYIIYLMNLAATVLSYWLFAYRTALFSAHQRVDIINSASFFVNLIAYIVQIVVLIIFKNYYLYLLVYIISQIVTNIVIAILSKSFYPNYYPSGSLCDEERKKINEKVRDLFTAKIGVVINTSADALVISAFLGLKIVAIYQNYFYIVSSLMALFNIFLAACTAGIGNSLVVKSKEENRDLLYRLNHIVFFALNFSCACLISLLQPFMKLWVGNEYLLGFEHVILLGIYLYVEVGPRSMLIFKDAGGIWRADRFRPLITALTNLTLNLIMVKKIGLYGVLLSTILSFMIIAFPWLIYNIHRCLFELDIVRYFLTYVTYAIVAAFDSAICYMVNSRITIHNVYIDIIVRFLVCAVISTTIFEIVFLRKKENEYLIDMIKTIVKKRNV